ncbi:MAG: hypothetical protein R3Y59_00240 [bacterium]
MKEIVKYLGVILILIGVGIFFYYSTLVGAHNGLLYGGISCVVGGLIVHILLNKYLR